MPCLCPVVSKAELNKSVAVGVRNHRVAGSFDGRPSHSALVVLLIIGAVLSASSVWAVSTLNHEINYAGGLRMGDQSEQLRDESGEVVRRDTSYSETIYDGKTLYE